MLGENNIVAARKRMPRIRVHMCVLADQGWGGDENEWRPAATSWHRPCKCRFNTLTDIRHNIETRANRGGDAGVLYILSFVYINQFYYMTKKMLINLDLNWTYPNIVRLHLASNINYMDFWKTESYNLKYFPWKIQKSSPLIRHEYFAPVNIYLNLCIY